MSILNGFAPQAFQPQPMPVVQPQQLQFPVPPAPTPKEQPSGQGGMMDAIMKMFMSGGAGGGMPVG